MNRSRTLPAALCAASVAVLALSGCAADRTAAASPARFKASAAQPAATPATQTVTVRVPAGMHAAPFDQTRRLTVPKGWKVEVWSRVNGARLQAWTPDKRLLVSRPDSGDIVELTPHASGAPSQTTLVHGLSSPHGMAFHGSTLWVAERNEIDTYAYSAGKVGARHVVVGDLPGASGNWAHLLKSVVVDKAGNAYYSIGSSGNISGSDRDASPQAAVIMQWNAATHKTSVYARGVRNGTGLAFGPDGSLWTAVNNRDQLSYPYHKDYDGNGTDDYGKVITGYVNEHPIEPVVRLSRSRDLGWPYCDPDPDLTPGSRSTALSYTRRPFVTDPDTNPTGSRLNCAKLVAIDDGLPAHSAPLGMSFATLPAPYGTGALIAVHGSWDRTPPRAPQVWFFPWSPLKGSTKKGLVNRYPLVSGFQDASGSRWGRTVSAVAGPDHAVYISDDQAGAIYRLTPG